MTIFPGELALAPYIFFDTIPSCSSQVGEKALVKEEE